MNKHAIDIISKYLKKMMRSGNAVSSDSERGIALADCEKEEFD